MQPIQTLQSIDLENVRGGFIGALLGAAPGILQGVSGIIAASKSGKQQQQGPAGPPPGAETAAAAQGAASGGMPPGGAAPQGLPPSGGGGSGVQISISINGVAQPQR